MNNLLVTNNESEEVTMTSVELLEVINQYRIEDGKKAMRHNNFMQKIRDEFEEEALLKFQHSYQGVDNATTICYKLPKDECFIMAMRESKYVRRNTVDYIKRLEKEVTTPALPQTYLQALEALVASEKEKEALGQELLIAAPKVEYHDKVVDAVTCKSWNNTAKVLGVGRNKMLQFLRDKGVINRHNVPYQNYLDQKLFEVKTSVNKTGYMSQTTYVTGKGETWLFKFLTKNNFI